GLCHRLAAHRDRGGPDVLGRVLDPAGGRKMLREFLLRRGGDGDVAAEHDGARGRGALIDGQHKGHGDASPGGFGWGEAIRLGKVRQEAAGVTPPSTTIVCPVMKVEASEARYATAPAISSGSPIRRSGVLAVRRLRLSGSSHSARAKSVLTRPGATQSTRTPFGPHSPARLRHSAKSAAFEMP